MQTYPPRGTLLRVRTALCLVLCSLMSGTCCFAQEAKVLWAVDLSANQDFLRRSHASILLLHPPALDFLDNDRILLSFDDDSASVPTPTNLAVRPFGFHVLEINAGNGSTGNELSFPVVRDTSRAAAIAEGGFFVIAGQMLKKFDSRFQEAMSLPAPLGKVIAGQNGSAPGDPSAWSMERWEMDVTPGGNELLLAHLVNSREMHVSWLLSRNLHEVASTTLLPGKSISAAHEKLFQIREQPLVALADGHVVPICPNCRPVSKGGFLTDDLLFLAERDHYKLMSTSGALVSSGKLKVGVSSFCRSRASNRFAFTTGYYQGLGFPLESDFSLRMTVRVVDWKSGKEVSSVSIAERAKPASSGGSLSAIALSPDGARLLVLQGSLLSCYALPKP